MVGENYTSMNTYDCRIAYDLTLFYSQENLSWKFFI